MPLFHSGKFRRYDQQPSNSAGNALWDLLSTRNTTIQVNVSYCSRHWENTALCKFFSGYVWPSSKSASLSGHEHSQVRKMKYFFGYFFHTNSTHRPYVPESFHHHLRTQPDFPILPPSQPSQPPAYTQVGQDTLRIHSGWEFSVIFLHYLLFFIRKPQFRPKWRLKSQWRARPGVKTLA